MHGQVLLLTDRILIDVLKRLLFELDLIRFFEHAVDIVRGLSLGILMMAHVPRRRAQHSTALVPLHLVFRCDVILCLELPLLLR